MSRTYADRLAELRRFDSVGHYVHDRPVTGHDETGTLLVTITRPAGLWECTQAGSTSRCAVRPGSPTPYAAHTPTP